MKQKRIYFIGDSYVYSANLEQAKELVEAGLSQGDLNTVLVKMKRLKGYAPNVGSGKYGNMYYAYWLCNLDTKFELEQVKKDLENFK